MKTKLTRMSLGNLAGLAAKSAVLRLIGKNVAHEYLMERLQEVPGVPSKLSQILGSKMGVISKKAARQELSPDFVLEYIESENPNLFSNLDEFHESGCAASLSQVHQAKLRNGEDVAIKIQYPGIFEEMQRQIDMIFDLADKFAPMKNAGWESAQFRSHFETSLLDELRYDKEAGNQGMFVNAFKEVEFVKVPFVYREYSNSFILTQQLISSSPLHVIQKWSQEDRRQVAQNFFDVQMHSLFKLGTLHGDLHAGNWGAVSGTNQIVLYDFGSVLSLQADQVKAIKDCATALCNETRVDFLKTLSLIGFDEAKLYPLQDIIQDIVHLLFEPMLAKGPWSPKQWNLSVRLTTLLGERKWMFRAAGPAWFLSFMRSFMGVFSAIHSMDVSVDNVIARQYLTGNADTGVLPLQFVSGPQENLARSQKLCVSVSEGSETVVELEFPIHAVYNLRNLIPRKTLSRLESSGYNIEKIIAQVVDSGFCAQTLVRGSNNGRSYHIWVQ